ncbi:hypothetical protein B1R32_106124 [Abditibacterium utsteinense]|uniref:DUF2642 domain-containing protein n=1 Tax=Abditibacterium utsteinense TaxID=1960156 RepID=A0A2S8SU24_9BACT|nr:hypothetical protein [Abditibacterium utsteinense]PQV64278.1 hypothetical protein B1R32_106124 [Abditibacterium utsteinense]
MSANLKDFIGKHVDVWTVMGQTETKDSGILRNVDEAWIVIEKNNELLFFSMMRVRLVKPTL